VTSDAHRASLSPWWNHKWFLALLAFVSAIPLIGPHTPPLTDLIGHMGRYHIQLTLADIPALQAFYRFDWALIGNLGVDLLIIPMSKLFGLELGVKLIVICIPILTVAGYLTVAREVHGQVPPTAFFALPLAYAYPFHFGFVNFALSVALTFLAFAWWLNMGRRGQFRQRIFAFVALSCVIWVVHIFGWATLCVLAFSAEIVRHRESGAGWRLSLWRTVTDCLPLTAPILLMALSLGSQGEARSGDWFNFYAKFMWLLTLFRDHWQGIDLLSVLLLIAVILFGFIPHRFSGSAKLRVAALLMLVIYVLLPRILIGSAYADMRLLPILFAVLILAIRPAEAMGKRARTVLALAGLAFFAARLGATTLSFSLADQRLQNELVALDHIPAHSRVIGLVGRDLPESWEMHRRDHIHAFLLIRKDSFSNEQFEMPGAQLLKVKASPFAHFAIDPTELVRMPKARHPEWRSIEEALQLALADKPDFVWIVDDPRGVQSAYPGFEFVWHQGASAVLRPIKTEPPAATPQRASAPARPDAAQARTGP
jgi:hypothetical protein